jgi:hypothetical protein
MQQSRYSRADSTPGILIYNIYYRIHNLFATFQNMLQIKPNWCRISLSMVISFLYVFRATVCPSPREITVFMRTCYLLFCVDDSLVCMVAMSFIPLCIPDSHPYRVTGPKCRMGTVISPDDGQICARNL